MRSLLAGALMALLLASSLAHAQSIETARDLYLGADFERSVRAFEAVLARPDLTRFDALQAHLHLAALHLVLENPSQATVHARTAVALDPGAQPPPGAPPRLREELQQARRALGEQAAALSLQAEPRGKQLFVVATVDPAPEPLADSVVLRCGPPDGPQQSRRSALPRVSLRDAAGKQDGPLRCRAEVRTTGGAVLLEQERTFAPASATSAKSNSQDEPRRVWRWVGGATGAAAAVAAVTAALVVTQRGDGEQARITGARVEP
jgi:hypothetical protein